MDDTDRRLVKGLIWLVVFGSLAYVFPGFWFMPGGYRKQKQEEVEAHERLRQSAEKYRRYYGSMHAAYFGGYAMEPASASPGAPLRELKQQFNGSNAEIQQLIEQKEKASRMSFQEWTKVPETEERNPGVYFVYMWQRKKNMLATQWIEAKVECMDPDIGFQRFKGEIATMNKNKAEEYLRELYIAEKIIQLCILAKQRQERFEKENSFPPEAYMRIISVTPQDSTTAGPSALIVNPKYNPEEKNPTSERFRKYNVKYWKQFIQEYPVQIVLQCDVNCFMRFLHSVRSADQFLVIRRLEILSPFLEDSLIDKSELDARDLQVDPNDPDKRPKLKEEHILVRMSAAGMDFFDPVKNPHGLYDAGKKEIKPTTTGPGRRKIPVPAGP